MDKKWNNCHVSYASILLDDDAKNYLVYGNGKIKIKELNSELTDFVPGAQKRTLFRTGISGLTGEVSGILKINNYYYIFIIAWPSGSICTEYVYRSRSIMG